MDDTGLRRRARRESVNRGPIQIPLTESDHYKRALRLLARRDHSRSELRRKLLRNRSSEGIDEVLDRLGEQGFLDDEAFAFERALFRRQHRLWGDIRLSQDLKRLGIDARMIRRVLEQVNGKKAETETLQEAIERWVGKSGKPETPTLLKKLYDHCVRLGYVSHMVRQQLEPYFEQIDWGAGHS